MNASHSVIPKRTVAPLFDFRPSIQGVYDLGGDVILRQTDHAGIRRAMDAFFARPGKSGERFIIYPWSDEREEFEAADFCLEHTYKAPDYVGKSEEQSKAELQIILIAMRVVKLTLAKPGFYLRWEDRAGGWRLEGLEKLGFSVYRAPDEHLCLQPFSAADVVSLAEMLPRIRQAYASHDGGCFHRVANALNFFEMGYRYGVAEVRFVLFVTVLESLFVTSDGGVSRQFRERISRFLAQAPADRQRLEDTCRAIYTARSDIVHGQPVVGGAHRLLLEVQGIGRRCLKKVLGDDNLFASFSGPASALGRFLEGLP